jgi:hypothetical protein
LFVGKKEAITLRACDKAIIIAHSQEAFCHIAQAAIELLEVTAVKMLING